MAKRESFLQALFGTDCYSQALLTVRGPAWRLGEERARTHGAPLLCRATPHPRWPVQTSNGPTHSFLQIGRECNRMTTDDKYKVRQKVLAPAPSPFPTQQSLPTLARTRSWHTP